MPRNYTTHLIKYSTSNLKHSQRRNRLNSKLISSISMHMILFGLLISPPLRYLSCLLFQKRIVSLEIHLTNDRTQRVGEEETTSTILFTRSWTREDLPETKSLVTL